MLVQHTYDLSFARSYTLSVVDLLMHECNVHFIVFRVGIFWIYRTNFSIELLLTNGSNHIRSLIKIETFDRRHRSFTQLLYDMISFCMDALHWNIYRVKIHHQTRNVRVYTIDKLHAMHILVSTRSHKHYNFFRVRNIEIRDYLAMAISFRIQISPIFSVDFFLFG